MVPAASFSRAFWPKNLRNKCRTLSKIQRSEITRKTYMELVSWNSWNLLVSRGDLRKLNGSWITKNGGFISYSFPIQFLFISYSIPIHFFISHSFLNHFLFISYSFPNDGREAYNLLLLFRRLAIGNRNSGIKQTFWSKVMKSWRKGFKALSLPTHSATKLISNFPENYLSLGSFIFSF